MNQNLGGWLLIAVAGAMLANNLSDAIGDLKAWHMATTPEFVAVVLKQVSSVVLAALGGKMTDQFGAK